MKDIKEIKKELQKRIFSKKCVSKKGYKHAILLLDTIKDNEEYKTTYNNLMGKILVKQKKYKEAKIYFEEELLTNPNSESAHFNLYKIHVFEHNYKEAISNLLYCKNNNTKNIDATLPLIMLQALYDINNDIEIFLNTNYQINHTPYFCYNNLENTSAFDTYQKIINNWNNQNYLELKDNVLKLDEIIKNNNIKIEVTTLNFITNTLINNLEKEINKKLTEHKTNNIYNNKYKSLLIKGFNLNVINIKQLLNIIDNLINYNIELANELFNYIINNNNLDNYKIEVNYLKNKLNEKNIYNSLSEEQQKLYNYYIIEGSLAYKNSNLNTALNYYKQGKETINHPIFDYYIGKIYFKLRILTPSYEYISKYEENGGEKELHALLYLWANNKFMKNKKRMK